MAGPALADRPHPPQPARARLFEGAKLGVRKFLANEVGICMMPRCDDAGGRVDRGAIADWSRVGGWASLLCARGERAGGQG